MRLAVAAKANALGVTTAFEIEHAIVAPTVLIVSNQLAFQVGGQGSLARAGQAEEQRHVALMAGVGGTVHGKDSLQRHQVIHHGEDGLLHLPGVVRSSNESGLGFEIQRDERFRFRAVGRGLGVAIGRGDDGELRFVAVEFTRRGPAEKLMNKQRMPGQLADDADRQTMRGVSAGESIKHKNFAAFEMFVHAPTQPLEIFT